MTIGRRPVLIGLLLAAVGAPACSRAGGETQDQAGASTAKRAMLVHRDPNCGCCEAWAKLARAEGYVVQVVDSEAMPAVKRQLGVPPALASCHTAEVDGAVIEGHVPFPVLARFLAERPPGARGLAVPGMPVGSPGMEVPGQPADPLVVHLFDDAGKSRVYAAFPGGAGAHAGEG